MKTVNILCLGDSLTDCGRLYTASPLGNGYVRLMDRYRKEHRLNWRFTNRGYDGFTVMRLLQALSGDPLSPSPDIITILIGINDVALMRNTCVLPEQQDKLMARFSDNYNRLVERLKAHTNRILLMEPFLFPWPLEYLTWMPRLLEMSRKISSLAREHGCLYLPLHEYLNQRAEELGPETVTTDGVHLTERGHELLAERLLPALTELIRNPGA